jgi:pyruvate kinase
MINTRIIATIGPSDQKLVAGSSFRPVPYRERLSKFARAGADVFRVNMAFYPDRQAMDGLVNAGFFQAVRAVRKPVAVMADIGPKLRIAGPKEYVVLKRGEQLLLHFRDTVPGTAQSCSVVLYDEPFAAMLPALKQAFRLRKEVFIAIGEDDVVLSARQRNLNLRTGTLSCMVFRAGRFRGRKGLTFQHVRIEFPDYLAPRTRRQIDFLLGYDIASLALSFVQGRREIAEVRNYVTRYSRAKRTAARSAPMLVAKIETADGVRNIDEILGAADGIMIARGDLGLQIGLAQVPAVQKEIIRKCNRLGKPVITATQMLESMTEHPTPTRAEAADVFNAILDGSDAILLSNETSDGPFAVQAIRAAREIVTQAEKFRARAGHELKELRCSAKA